jgi:hypothetical protein
MESAAKAIQTQDQRLEDRMGGPTEAIELAATAD